MKNSLYIVYDNNNLDLFVFGNYEKNPVLLYEKRIERFRIKSLEDSFYLESLKKKIIEEYNTVITQYKLLEEDIKFIISPNNFYFQEYEYTKKFEKAIQFEKKDIQEIKKLAMNYDKLEPSMVVIDIDISEKYIDQKLVKDYIGLSGKEISFVGNILVCDKRVYINLKDLLEGISIKFSSVIIPEYYLKDIPLENNTGIMDLRYDHIIFISKIKGNIENITINVGIKLILENLYTLFSEKYGKSMAEKLVRFTQETWILKKFPYNYDIIDGINVNGIIEDGQQVISQGFNYIFKELKNKGINLMSVNLISEDISPQDLSDFLESQLDLEFKPLFKRDFFVSSLVTNKLGYCIKKDFEG